MIVCFQDGLVHVQSLDHALPVVHQTLEADTGQGNLLCHPYISIIVKSTRCMHNLRNGVTGLTLLHQDEEEQTIHHLQGEGKRNAHDHHQEVLLVEKKMENIVAGPIPLAMKVLLLQTGTEMETMRLESK